MTEVEKSDRNNRLNKIRSNMKIMPMITNSRANLETKMEKRRKRKQSLAMNPNDFTALDEDKKSIQALEDNEKVQKIFQKYQLLEKIGQGSNGVVRKCKHKQKNKIYAVKCMQLNEEHCLFLKKNFKFIKKLDHPNIIKYKALYLDLQKRRCYLVMTYETMPSLQKFNNLTEEEVREIMKQLLNVLFYLHTRNICHRDIKPDNILYDRLNKKIKIIDFGISKKFFVREKKNQFLTITGTLYYRAPQMFLGSGYDESVDMWAAGITLYKLIEGKTPFESQFLSDTIENIRKAKIDYSESAWQDYSNLAKDLVNRLLLKNREERLSAIDAQKHLWFSEKLVSSSEGDLTHSDSFQLKLKRINSNRQKEYNEKKEEPIRKNSQMSVIREEVDYESMKNRFNHMLHLGDSDDEDVLIEINSEGEEIKSFGGRTPKQFDDKETPTTAF